jgi:CHAD domain-containing protein
MPVDRDRSRLLARRISGLASKLNTSPQAEDVHRFRTNVRRLEAMLSVLDDEGGVTHKKVVKLLDRLRRRAGKVRDIDVQIAALRTLKLPEQADRKSQLLRVLTDLRVKREKKLARAADEETVGKLRKRLRKVESALVFPDNVNPPRIALQQFADLAREHGPLNEERMHAYRLAGKRLRYIAEMAGKDPEAQRLVSEFKRMQDALGEWHDWFALTASAEHTFKDTMNSALISALRSVKRDKFREAVQAVSEVKRNLLGRPAPIREMPSTEAARSATLVARKPTQTNLTPTSQAVA